jgi:hypothetical protein
VQKLRGKARRPLLHRPARRKGTLRPPKPAATFGAPTSRPRRVARLSRRATAVFVKSTAGVPAVVSLSLSRVHAAAKADGASCAESWPLRLGRSRQKRVAGSWLDAATPFPPTRGLSARFRRPLGCFLPRLALADGQRRRCRARPGAGPEPGRHRARHRVRLGLHHHVQAHVQGPRGLARLLVRPPPRPHASETARVVRHAVRASRTTAAAQQLPQQLPLMAAWPSHCYRVPLPCPALAASRSLSGAGSRASRTR